MNSDRKNHHWAPLIVLSATLLVSAAISWQFRRLLEETDWVRFQGHTEEVKAAINNHLENTIALLRGGAGLFAVSEAVTRDDFRAYVERLEIGRRYPGIQGLGWVRRVPAGEKDMLIQAMRDQGIDGFRIWPEQVQDEYYPILYLEPLDARNRVAIGYDMASEPVRRAAMERARDSGARLSGKVTLLQEIVEPRQPGFLIYVPVYQGGRIPATVEERRARLLGFVYSPLRAVDFLDNLFDSGFEPPVSFDIFDGSEASPAALLYRSEPGAGDYRPRFSAAVTLMAAGQPWTLVVASRPGFERFSNAFLTTGVFLGGALISLLLTGVTWIQTKARQTADQSAAQLRQSQQDLQRTTQALQHSQDRLHLALEAARMAVWEWDIESGLLRESDEMGTLFGRGGGQIHASYQAFLDDIHPQDRQQLDAALKQAVAGCVPYDAEFRLSWPDGSVHWLAARGKVICDEARRPLSTIGVTLDITRRKQAEEGLREADRRKNVFLATLAHELRNPLSAISNSLKIIRLAGAGDQSLASAAEMAERQLSHLVRLVGDLLDISRITQGKIDLQKERAELSTIVENAVESCHALLASAGHELTVSLCPEPLLIEADAARITQVVTNLLTNAAKYTPERGRIWLSTERQGAEAVMRVRDTGIGIAAAILPRIFDMFIQADSASDRTRDGLGIGLALVKSLVQLHQGRVEAHSAGPGQGSEFLVRLPLAAERPPGEQSPGRESAGPGRAQFCRILVVDDNRDSADSITLLLRLLGHEVRLAYNGPDALSVAASFKPAVVLLDIGLPGMDGYQVAQRLRRQFPNLVLVAMTGWGSDDDRRRAKEAGFDHHLIKPLDLAALTALLAGLSPPEN